MPEGKKNTAPLPAPVRDEDGYSAKTHLHQPVQETATVAATALLADAPEGALPSEVRPEIVTWEKLCEAIQASGKAYNMEMIQKAYELANNAHNGVCRRSGEPYICHPLAVARLVLDLGMDSESIAAALLHDVVEDTPTTLDDLTAQFGSEVAQMVDGVTKLTKIQFSNIEELQAENLRKMLLAMSRDVRVMIIKLCDRLHNMRTGDAWPEQKRRDKARETMEVYAPIANRLGILNVKEELEDRSLHYLDPVGYNEISKMLSERAGEESFVIFLSSQSFKYLFSSFVNVYLIFSPSQKCSELSNPFMTEFTYALLFLKVIRTISLSSCQISAKDSDNDKASSPGILAMSEVTISVMISITIV